MTRSEMIKMAAFTRAAPIFKVLTSPKALARANRMRSGGFNAMTKAPVRPPALPIQTPVKPPTMPVQFSDELTDAATGLKNVTRPNVVGAANSVVKTTNLPQGFTPTFSATLAPGTNTAAPAATKAVESATDNVADSTKFSFKDFWGKHKNPLTIGGVGVGSGVVGNLLGRSSGHEEGFGEGTAVGASQAYARARQEAAQMYDQQGFFDRLRGQNPYQ